MLRHSKWVAILIFLVVLIIPIQAQSSVVYGLFFYSPTCPHCHEVMTEYWPSLEREFGNQLQVLFVDVTTGSGSALMSQTIAQMQIPSTGVPMLIIGNDVLIGSIDIPARAAPLVRAGLDYGGIGYPPVQGIGAWFEGEFGAASTSPIVETPSFASDWFANSLAVIVLSGLIISLFVFIAGTGSASMRQYALGEIGYFFVLVASVFGMILAFSVLMGESQSMLIQSIAAVIGLVLGSIVIVLFVQPMRSPKLSWLPPVLMVLGLFVAGYLAYVEVTASDAVCGAVGNCNVVQQSEYASIFGVPIGVLGILGYSVMLVLWFVSQTTDDTVIFERALLGLAVFGVGFSIYLTFLEPFVIGATCVWCLLSATIMLLLLWVSESVVWEASQKQKLAPEKQRQ